MTKEANAAIEGAYQGGATSVVVKTSAGATLDIEGKVLQGKSLASLRAVIQAG